MSSTQAVPRADDIPENHDIFTVPAEFNDVYSNRIPDISPMAVIGTPSTPWRPLMLLALWYPSVLDVRLFNRLESPQQNLLFDMVTSALDDYYVWYLHPNYQEPEVISHTLNTILYNFRDDPAYIAASSLAPRTVRWRHQDFVEMVDEWLEDQSSIPKNLHVQLTQVQSLFAPLSIVTPPDEDFPNGWRTPDVWDGFYLDRPCEETVVYKVPNNSNFLPLGKIPPRLHWNQFVKSDDFDDDFSATVKVERAQPSAIPSSSPSVPSSYSGTAPLLPRPQSHPRPKPRPTPTVVKQDKGKQRAIPTSIPVVPLSKKRKAPVEDVAPTKVQRTQDAQEVSEARRETSQVLDTPLPGPGPRRSGRARKTLHTFNNPSLLVLDSYESSDDEFVPSPHQTTSPSTPAASGSSRTTAQQEFRVKKRPPGYYSHPHRISIPKPSVDTSMTVDSDSEAVAAPFRELSIQPAEPAPAVSMTPVPSSASPVKLPNSLPPPVEPTEPTPATSTPPPVNPVKTAVSISKDKISPKPTSAVSQPGENVAVKKTKHSRRAPTSHALVKVPTSTSETIEVPSGSRQFVVPAGYSIHSSVTPSFHLAPPRVLGDFTIPSDLYGVKHRMEAIRETMRARQVSARYATSSSFAPILGPCENCGHHGVVCFPRTGDKSCLNCRRSGLGCNFSSGANFSNAADRADGVAQFSTARLDSLALDEYSAQQRMELSVASALLDINEYHTRRYKLTSALTSANQASEGFTSRLQDDVDISPQLKQACVDLKERQEEYDIVPSADVIFDENVRAELSQSLVDWFEGKGGKGSLPSEWSSNPQPEASSSRTSKRKRDA
ncbi:hypothetical protein VKT23_016912 [Stygiomarasmius scandens]|uniref:Zn(2)-C6 fungal-type domain-containing protein n=1 Tax=Marasmiellus scandens TaxID=2682957 RepID=A0ABR1IT92_9AGAR